MEKALTEPKLTPKQRKFLKLYFKYGNGTKAALESYDTDDYMIAASIANQNLKKLHAPIKTFMEANGLGIGCLTSVLAGGLQAKKIHSSPTEPDKVIEDWAVRHKYLETASKWLGVEGSSNENDRLNNLKRRVVAEEFFTEGEK